MSVAGDVHDLLANVRDATLRAEADALARAKLEAPNFNLLEFARTDELGLSAILRWMLDPRASHGQGALFLLRFLDRFCPAFQPADAKNPLSVETEAITAYIAEYLRRHDILITWHDGVLGIENKPWATYQENQIGAYLDDLSSRHRSHLLIVISGRGDLVPLHACQPKRLASAEESGSFLLLSYIQLSDWLRDISSECAAPLPRMFLEHLAQSIGVWFMGTGIPTETAAVLDSICHDGNTIRAAFQVHASIELVKERLWPTFVASLKGALRSAGSSMSIDELAPRNPAAVHASDKEAGWLLPDHPEWTVAFVFSARDNGACVGIRATQGEASPTARKLHNLANPLTEVEGPTPWWPCWSWFQDDLIDGIGLEFWSQIIAGEELAVEAAAQMLAYERAAITALRS